MPADLERTEKMVELALILSENDNELMDFLTMYTDEKIDEFREKYQPFLDENLLYMDEEDISFEYVIRECLNRFGYMGTNDWKFPLEDLLFNSKKAFEHYKIDTSAYGDIPDKDRLCAPEALKLIEAGLPDGFGLGMWDFGDDCLDLIVSKKSALKSAEKLAEEIGLAVYSDCSREY